MADPTGPAAAAATAAAASFPVAAAPHTLLDRVIQLRPRQLEWARTVPTLKRVNKPPHLSLSAQARPASLAPQPQQPGAGQYKTLVVGGSRNRTSQCSLCGSGQPTPYFALTCHRLTIDRLDALIHRGWRRFGKVIYRAQANRLCCAQHYYRIHVAKFSPTSRDVLVMTAFNRYLATGQIHGSESSRRLSLSPTITMTSPRRALSAAAAEVHDPNWPQDPAAGQTQQSPAQQSHVYLPKVCVTAADGPSTPLAPVALPSPNRTSCSSSDIFTPGPTLTELCHKQMSTFVPKGLPPRFELEVRLVPARPTIEGYRLYVHYQTRIHSDAQDTLSYNRFVREMCLSPLTHDESGAEKDPASSDFGCFHLEFLLNGRLVGLQTIDVLPAALCPVSFAYEVALNAVNFEHYARLRVIDLATQLRQRHPGIKYVYGLRALSLHHFSGVKAVENAALEIQPVGTLGWSEFAVWKAAILQQDTSDFPPVAPTAAGDHNPTPDTKDPAIDAEAMRVAEGTTIEPLASWQEGRSPLAEDVAACTQALGATVCRSLTLVLNALPMD